MKNELLLISIASDSHRNIGCLALFAAAMNAGIPTNVLFIPRRDEYDETIFSGYLKSNGFSVVGISLTTRDYYFAVDITAHIKKALPDSHVIWGGIHPTSKQEECLTYADSICVGEGELALCELVRRIRDGQKISGIPGIGVKDAQGKSIVNPPRVIADLNSLPFPRFDFERFYVLDDEGLVLFGPKHYAKYSRNKKGDGYVLLTSRSCPHRCTYCINSFLNRLYGNDPARQRRRLTVDNVMKEITCAVSTIPGIGFINFMDDHFLTSTGWIDEFCDKYGKEVNLPFIIRATPETIKPGLIAQLKRVGLHTVQMGIQSGSERTHKLIFHRSFDRETVIEAAKVLSSNSLECMYDFIIENDFETDEDRDKSIELMLELPKPYLANLFVMTVFPGTDLERIYRERNMVPRIDPYQSNYFQFNENDFYYQLASVIPVVDERESRYIFDHRHDEQAISRLKTLYDTKVRRQS